MIPSIVFVFSIAALLQFGASYCRALLINCSKVELSNKFRELSGLAADRLGQSDFDYLLQLIRLAPRVDGDEGTMRAVTVYFHLACVTSKLVSPFSKQISQWFDEEFSRCAHFAAVALDRRLVSVPR